MLSRESIHALSYLFQQKRVHEQILVSYSIVVDNRTDRWSSFSDSDILYYV